MTRRGRQAAGRRRPRDVRQSATRSPLACSGTARTRCPGNMRNASHDERGDERAREPGKRRQPIVKRDTSGALGRPRERHTVRSRIVPFRGRAADDVVDERRRAISHGDDQDRDRRTKVVARAGHRPNRQARRTASAKNGSARNAPYCWCRPSQLMLASRCMSATRATAVTTTSRARGATRSRRVDVSHRARRVGHGLAGADDPGDEYDGECDRDRAHEAVARSEASQMARDETEQFERVAKRKQRPGDAPRPDRARRHSSTTRSADSRRGAPRPRPP